MLKKIIAGALVIFSCFGIAATSEACYCSGDSYGGDYCYNENCYR